MNQVHLNLTFYNLIRKKILKNEIYKNEVRKTYWEVDKRIIKFVAVMKEVYCLNLGVYHCMFVDVGQLGRAQCSLEKDCSEIFILFCP